MTDHTIDLATEAARREPRDDRPERSTSVFELLRIDKYSGVYVWVLLVVIFGLVVPETFLTIRTWRALSSDLSITALLAMAALVPLAAATFDLSIAHVMGLAVVVVTWSQREWDLHPLLAVVLCGVVGALIGALNGLIVTRFHVSSLIATLGMSSIIQASILWLTDGQNISTGISEGFRSFGTSQPFGVPVPVIILAIVSVVLWYLLEHTPVGRYLYAVGGNAEAARLAGVRTDRYVFWSLVSSGFLASMVGVLFASKIGSASISAGPPYLLPAVAAVFLGATQLRPGRVNVGGTLVAIVVLATGVKGLQLLGVPFWVQDLFNGSVLIIAVALSSMRGALRTAPHGL